MQEVPEGCEIKDGQLFCTVKKKNGPQQPGRLSQASKGKKTRFSKESKGKALKGVTLC